MHYYQFNIGDYIKHTLHLTAEEDLCYRRLLDLYYDTEQPIATDIPWVSRRIRLGSEVVESVLREFFELTDEGYKNHRCDAEIEAYHAYIDKQRSNGKLGGRPKKTQRKPTANPSETQTKPKKSLNINHETENINQSIRSAPLQKPSDVEPDVWLSFLAVRKQKRAAVTDLAVLGIRRESVKAGISLNKALTICCERGWASFKADWDWQGQGGQQPRKTQYQINQEGIARSLGLIPRNDPPEGGTIIEGDTYETTARLVDR